MRDGAMRKLMLSVAAAAGSCLGCAGPALAQNALGDGNRLVSPLERDLGRGVPQGRVNNRATFQQELNLRNAVVTGNAPGGASFRGDVGYIAPAEFRGELGSNDLFAFRRDSLFSGFAGLGIRGTDALQYQFALTTGNPRGLLGVGAVPRSGGGIGPQSVSPLNAPTFQAEVGAARDPNPPTAASTTDRTDQGGSMMGMLRSPASFNVNRGIQPEIMSSFQDGSTGFSWALTASALRGVRMARLLDAMEAEGRPGAAASTSAAGTSVALDRPQGADAASGLTRGPDLATPGSYQAMQERFRAAAEGRLVPSTSDAPAPAGLTPSGTQPAGTQPGGTTPGGTAPGGTSPIGLMPGVDPGTTIGTAEWEARLAAIRERLALDLNPAGATSAPAGGSATGLSPTTGLVGSPGSGTTGASSPGESPTGSVITQTPGAEVNLAEGMSAGSLGYRPLDPEVLRIIRESSVVIDRYADPSAASDAYDRHMAVAGDLLRRGAYFDAEERFTRAQAARRDDYLAAVGRTHAQIGAGMYLSAGVNLRRLLSDHPEVAATKFDPAMLPGVSRLEAVAIELRANASKALEGQGVLLGTDSALLLAYIGYQRGDQALVTEGLGTYRRLLGDAAPAAEAGGTRTHGLALLELITGVWGQTPQGTP